MNIAYSPSTGGFFSAEIHGAAVPCDAVAITEREHADLLAAQAGGKRIIPGAGGVPVAANQAPPTRDQQQAALQRAVQGALDVTAKAHGYDSIVAAVSYADEPAVPAFQAEGQALRAWRSRVWAAALPTLTADPLPTTDALVASLPAYVPPAP